MVTGKTLAYGIVGLTALLLGVITAGVMLDRGAVDSATVLPQPRPLPELSLIDQDGHAFGRESLRGHWSLLFAGYTYCPDVCPTTLAMLRELEKGLAGRKPQVVFLSVDPQRDSPERLKAYVRYFDPAFIGVTATEPALAAAAQALGIAYGRSPGTGPQDYTVDHSAMLILVDPDAAIAAYFLPPHRLPALKSDLVALMERRP